jgi:hypothetical protein
VGSARTSIRWATVGTVAALVAAAAGCGGGVGSGAAVSASTTAAGTGTSTTTTPTPLMWPRPTVDPAVAHWAKAWKHKISLPMQRATTRLAANVGPALAGSSAAAYRLTPAFNTLSNCRNPLDIGLAQTPPELARARRQTIHACRLIYIGTDVVISGLNTLSSTTADAGIARVRHGAAMLRRIGHEVRRAARPQ